MDPMKRALILFGVLGTHEELAGRDQRELWGEVGCHGAAMRIAHRAFRLHFWPMRLETFALERFQSIWENRVAWNVSESGVHPLRVSELIDSPALRDALLEQELGYPQINGTVALREAIAAIYPGATPDHVQVTNGGSEANCIPLMRLVEPGDVIVFLTPTYIRANYPLVRRWIERHDGLSHIAPEAGAIAFVRHTHPFRSSDLTERPRDERGVLLVPGDYFDTDGYFLIGFGSDPEYLESALFLIGELLASVGAHAR